MWGEGWGLLFQREGAATTVRMLFSKFQIPSFLRGTWYFLSLLMIKSGEILPGEDGPKDNKDLNHKWVYK